MDKNDKKCKMKLCIKEKTTEQMEIILKKMSACDINKTTNDNGCTEKRKRKMCTCSAKKEEDAQK